MPLSTICQLKKNILIPPTEAHSAILEISAGCSWAKCSFCPQSAGVPLQVSSPQMLANRLIEIAASGAESNRLFLAGENALAFKTRHLLEVVDIARSYLPNVDSFSICGRCADVERKSDEQLLSLKKAGLKTVYIGIESGNAHILQSCEKGESLQQMKEQLQRLDNLGIHYGLSVILGLGGKTMWREHALDTAAFLSSVNPKSIRAMTLVIVKGTPLEMQLRDGQFIPCSAAEILEEEWLLLQNLKCQSPCLFISNHVYETPTLSAVLPEEKPRLEQELSTLLHSARNNPRDFHLGNW